MYKAVGNSTPTSRSSPSLSRPRMKVTALTMEGHNIFPVPNATTPYWRSELHEIDSIRSTEDLPESCDVLIIGAGLSGVTTAYHLLDENPSPPSIVILEARQVCSGATGRNGKYPIKLFAKVRF